MRALVLGVRERGRPIVGRAGGVSAAGEELRGWVVEVEVVVGIFGGPGTTCRCCVGRLWKWVRY